MPKSKFPLFYFKIVYKYYFEFSHLFPRWEDKRVVISKILLSVLYPIFICTYIPYPSGYNLYLFVGNVHVVVSTNVDLIQCPELTYLILTIFKYVHI